MAKEPKTNVRTTKYYRHDIEQHVRDKICVTTHLNQIERLVNKAQAFALNPDAKDKSHPDNMSKDQLTALKTSMEAHFKVLAKIMPDMKATELKISADLDSKSLHELSNADLAKIIEGEYDRVNPTGQIEGSSSGDTEPAESS